MSIRFPLQAILSATNNNEVGAGSVNGVVNAGTFTIPQDADSIVLKLKVTSTGGGFSAQLQTTDDGGTTWYGLARTSIVSAATGDATEWLSVPVAGYGIRSSSVVSGASVISGLSAIGNASPSTLGSGQSSGLPILGTLGRVVLQMQSGITASSVQTTVYVNSQSSK